MMPLALSACATQVPPPKSAAIMPAATVARSNRSACRGTAGNRSNR